MSIVLDQPSQINMWVLLSRRHQIQLHLKGIKVPGIVACLKREFGDHGRYVKNYIVPVEFAISEAGGEVDYKLVNVHVLEKVNMGLLQDLGIHESPTTIAESAYLAMLASSGRLEIVLTTEDTRPPTGNLYETL